MGKDTPMDLQTAHQFLATCAEEMVEHITSACVCPICSVPAGQTHDQDEPCSDLIDAVKELQAAESGGKAGR